MLVCGSRTFNDYPTMACWLGDFSINQIISGAAEGADKLVEEYAKNHGIDNVVVPADWEQHGKIAGIQRNMKMLDMKPDLVVAFWDGESRGTEHTVTEAARRKISTLLVYF